MTLSATLASDAVSISVADTGTGIAPESIPHLFERYYRGEDARTRGEGTGLGLAIAASVARAHGGTLTVESTPGAGSTFILRLPPDGAHERFL